MTSRVNTRSMFVDLVGLEERSEGTPEFTIQEYDIERDGKKYKSLYKLFMQSADEYDFAIEHLGGLDIFNQLTSAKWFSEGYRAHRGIAAWREDMRARDESLAKKAILLAVRDGDINAAKKLFDVSKKTNTTRGRFVKDEAKKEAAKMAEDKDFLKGAASRLDNVINIMD